MKDENIVFVGGGIGNTHAIAALVDNLEKAHLSSQDAKHIHIKIFDVRPEYMGRGAGWSSHPNLLMNSRVFPQGPAYEWLRANKDRWMDYLKLHDSHNTLGLKNPDEPANANKWFPKFRHAIETNDFEAFCLPRLVMGYYSQEMLFNTVEKAKKLGIDLHLIEGEVDKIQQGTKNWNVHLASGAGEVQLYKSTSANGVVDYNSYVTGNAPVHTKIKASEVVLGVGGARQKVETNIREHGSYFSFIDICKDGSDFEKLLYRISSAHTRAAKQKSHQGEPKIKIGILGQRSSFIDICRLLSGHPDLANKLDVTSIGNSSNDMPYIYARPPKGYSYKPLLNIDLMPAEDQRLRSAAGLLALFEAEMQSARTSLRPEYDVQLAEEAFFYQFLKKGIQKRKIDAKVAQEFLEGHEYSKVTGYTRVWEHTAAPARKMRDAGTLHLSKGTVRSLHPNKDKLQIAVADQVTGQTHNTDFDIVINALGFAPLKDTVGGFLKNAMENGLLEINPSGQGLLVNDNREILTSHKIQRGLFAVGVLVNGNYFSAGNNFSRVNDSGCTAVDQYRRFDTYFSSAEDGIIVGNEIANRLGIQSHASSVKPRRARAAQISR